MTGGTSVGVCSEKTRQFGSLVLAGVAECGHLLTGREEPASNICSNAAQAGRRDRTSICMSYSLERCMTALATLTKSCFPKEGKPVN